MSLTESQICTKIETIQKTEGNKIQTKQIKLTKRVYLCRPQVNQRKDWIKFGEVKDLQRGQNRRGQCNQNQQVFFENQEGDVQEELDLVKKIKNISKESVMLKNIRNNK